MCKLVFYGCQLLISQFNKNVHQGTHIYYWIHLDFYNPSKKIAKTKTEIWTQTRQPPKGPQLPIGVADKQTYWESLKCHIQWQETEEELDAGR